VSRRRRPAVERYHDRVAGRYDSSYDDEYWAWHDTLTWDHLKPHLPTDLRAPVADLGCGTGKWAAKIARSGYSVTCVDVSTAMLEQARQKLDPQAAEQEATVDLGQLSRETSARPRPSFVRADLCDLSMLPADHFALAVAFGEPIGCTSSPPAALKQIRRILRPDGTLVATFDNQLNAIDFYLQQGDPRSLTEFLHTGLTHWLTRDRSEQFPIHTYSPSRLAKLLESCGFAIVDLIGKTVLPMRHYRALLAEPEQRRALARIEKSLWRDPAALGRAAHLQVVARPN